MPPRLTGVPLEFDKGCNDDRNTDLSPDWLVYHLGNLSPHWLIGVPLEYYDGCNDDWTDEGPEEPPVDAKDGGQVDHLLDIGEELAAPIDPRHLHYLLKDSVQY